MPSGIAPVKKEFLKPISDLVPQPLNPSTETNDSKKRKRERGMNKDRPTAHSKDDLELCPSILSNRECRYGNQCRKSHNATEYLAAKQEDIGPECHNYNTFGFCKFGIACRFAKAHLNVKNENMRAPGTPEQIDYGVKNVVSDQMKEMRGLKQNLVKTPIILKQLEQNKIEKAELNDETTIGPVLLPNHDKKKTIDFRNKTYLAPLTTVGNLPFRRICKNLGVDITCGEMAVANNLLSMQSSEWALLRRHKSEDIFGIQLCGSNVDVMTSAGELINHYTNVDFVDINCGCPIDAVTKRGAGSGLIEKPSRLGAIFQGLNNVLDCPVTVKIRTGNLEGKPTLHKLIPKLKAWGVSAVTLHGRSRAQRYTKLADWDYIKQCADLVDGAFPFLGNGDIMSYEDYQEKLDQYRVEGAMIGRGALIKPWIFTEIKERKVWDISSRERLDLLKDFANYGLEHWGSDTQGVNITRRFMCEWLSFLYRYIPVGLLEVLPQKINERPPSFYGRDDLETLMGSDHCDDWIKLTEMVLGKAPSDFKFIPK